MEAAESCLAAAYPAIHIHYADIKLEETSNAFRIQRVKLKFALHANFLRSLISCFYQLSVKITRWNDWNNFTICKTVWDCLFVRNYQERRSEQHISKSIAEFAKPGEFLRVAPTQELGADLPFPALPSASPCARPSPRPHAAHGSPGIPLKCTRVCSNLSRASFRRELNGRVLWKKLLFTVKLH